MRFYICRYWNEWDWDDWDNKPIPEGFREGVIVSADTRGKAKYKYIKHLQREGYDPKWNDRFSIKLDTQKGQ